MVKAADEHIEAMHEQLKQAKFAWIPTIKTTAFIAPGVNTVCDDVTLVEQGSSEGFDFQYCRSGVDEDIDPQTIKGYFAQLKHAGVIFRFTADAVIPLYTFGKLMNLRRGAKELLALAGLKRQQVRQETVLRIYEAHSAVLLARESMTILETAWDVVQKERVKIESDLGAGEGWDADPEEMNPDRDPDDLLELELGEIELAQKMREARTIEGLALAALWAIAGEAAPQGFDIAETTLIADELAGGLDPVAEYQQMARHNRPEAKMAAAGVRLRKVQEKMARSNFLPDLGILVSAGVGVGSRADYAGLALNWNINFVQDAFALRKARAEHREAAHKAEAARILLSMEVEKAYRGVHGAEADMEFTALARDKSWQLLISQQQKSSVGGGDYSDLQKALRKWAEFEFKHFESIQRRNVAVAKLSRAVGSPLTDH
jgi:outer membrane protein TolC